MDRRTFLVGLGSAAAWLSVGGCTWPMLETPLHTQLAMLADPRFREYAESQSLPALYSAMKTKGIISVRHGIRHDKLMTLARQEPLIVYQGFYYTQTELDLYALAYLSSGAIADTYQLSRNNNEATATRSARSSAEK